LGRQHSATAASVRSRRATAGRLAAHALDHAAAAAGGSHRNIGAGVDQRRVGGRIDASAAVRNFGIFRRIPRRTASGVGGVGRSVRAGIGGGLLLAAAAAGREQEEDQQRHEAMPATGRAAHTLFRQARLRISGQLEHHQLRSTLRAPASLHQTASRDPFDGYNTSLRDEVYDTA